MLGFFPISADAISGEGVAASSAVSGTATVALSGLAIVASGTEAITGTAAVALSSLTAAASGDTSSLVTGTATVALPPLGVAASGTESITGTATVALLALGVTASGVEVIAGTASVALSSLAVVASGTGTAGVAGTAAVSLGALSIAADGTVAVPVTGTASVDLASLGVAATASVASVSASGPFILTQTLGSLRNDFDGYLGFKFNSGAFTPTVTALGRWKIAGNVQTHNLYLYQFVDGAGGDIQLATVVVDMTAGVDGAYLYASVTPVTLAAGTDYYVVSQESSGLDQWYDNDTTLDSFGPAIGTVSGSVFTGVLGSSADNGDPAHSYVPPNFMVGVPVQPIPDSTVTNRIGPVAVDKALDAGTAATMHFQIDGADWDAAGKSWGNRKAELFLLLASNPALARELRIFSGYTLQKENKGDTPVEAGITCIDRSVTIAGVPVCYSLGAWSGKRRGEIVREVARSIGFTDDQIRVPVGQVVNKPVLLNNASLLTWIADFGLCEHWWPYIDDDGNLVVQKVELKADPDWTIDASKGDFDLESFDERPPTRPPCRYYISAEEPIPTFGPEGQPAVTTSRQTDLEIGLYNPQSVKVRPSGGASNLQADGSYRIFADQKNMLVGKTITETTLSSGDEIRRVVTKYQFYNPAAFDPNFDTDPTGTSYDGAYGDKSFHRDECESLMEFSRETTETFRDLHGTVVRQSSTLLSWYAPLHALNFVTPADRLGIVNGGGGYVFGGGSMRVQQVETYQLVSEVDTTYYYNADGVLYAQEDVERGWTAPQGASDVEQLDGTTLAGVGGGPSRLGGFPEQQLSGWRPQVSGPYYLPPGNAGLWLFAVNFPQMPTGTTYAQISTGEVRMVVTGTDGDAQPDGTFARFLGGITYYGSGGDTQLRPVPGNWPLNGSLYRVYFAVHGVKPADYLRCYVRVAATLTGGAEAGLHWSAKLSFDPFAGVAVGGVI